MIKGSPKSRRPCFSFGFFCLFFDLVSSPMSSLKPRTFFIGNMESCFQSSPHSTPHLSPSFPPFSMLPRLCSLAARPPFQPYPPRDWHHHLHMPRFHRPFSWPKLSQAVRILALIFSVWPVPSVTALGVQNPFLKFYRLLCILGHDALNFPSRTSLWTNTSATCFSDSSLPFYPYTLVAPAVPFSLPLDP